MTALALELRDVFRIHDATGQGAVALQGLSLAVPEGERCVVLGPSGSGKSTLLRIAAGFDRPSAGVARTLGVDLGRLRGGRAAAFRARRLGFLDQHYARSLSPALTCAENVALPLRLAGLDAAARRRRALELLDRVGLGDRGDDLPAALSGGEQQRVAVCGSLVHRPAILFADEPAGELDVRTADAVYALLSELAAEEGATLVVVSHDERATELADRVVHVRDGRVSAESLRGEPTRLVIGRGGWLRLPAEARRRTGIEARAGWSVREREVGLAGDGEPQPEQSRPAAPPILGAVAATMRGVGKAYGRRHVLAGFDAELARGSLVALEGRSGSGKTTILHLLAGLERADSGSVEVAGRDLGDLDREELAALRRAHIGWVGQEPGLLPFATALENCVLALEVRDGGPPARARARGAGVARAARARGLRRPRRRPAVRGRAPAGGDRPRPRPEAGRAPAGRADGAARRGERRGRRRPPRHRRAHRRCGGRLRDARSRRCRARRRGGAARGRGRPWRAVGFGACCPSSCSW